MASTHSFNKTSMQSLPPFAVYAIRDSSNGYRPLAIFSTTDRTNSTSGIHVEILDETFNPDSLIRLCTQGEALDGKQTHASLMPLVQIASRSGYYNVFPAENHEKAMQIVQEMQSTGPLSLGD